MQLNSTVQKPLAPSVLGQTAAGKANPGEQAVIRSLVYVEESDIILYSRRCNHPIICCACQGCRMIDQKRQKMKQLVKTLAKDMPEIRRSLLASLANAHATYLLDGILYGDKG